MKSLDYVEYSVFVKKMSSAIRTHFSPRNFGAGDGETGVIRA
jgi:hypothetical protein